MTNRSIETIESDLTTIQRFATSYRAYWNVTSAGAERQPVKDRVALRHRLHRQLPAVEKIMVRANTNGFGFGPPPIARGGPPRMGIVAAAFADEDPVYGFGAGPACFEEVVNRLEMTLGVLESELEEARSGATRDRSPAPDSQDSVRGNETADEGVATPAEAVSASTTEAAPARIFLVGLQKAWRDARRARAHAKPSIERRIAVTAGVATIVGTVATLGVIVGWWGQ